MKDLVKENIVILYDEYTQYITDNSERTDIGDGRINYLKNSFIHFILWLEYGQDTYFGN